MLARCARVEPATMSASRLSLAFSTFSADASCTTFTSLLLSATLNVPLPPLMATLSALIVAVTPCGRGTGCLATRDIAVRLEIRLGHDADDFAAVPGGARLAIRHHALRRGNDGHTQSA